MGRGKHLVIMQRFRSLSGGYAGNSSKTVIIAIFVCSLFLHFDAVKSRKTPEMEPSFISTRELDLLTDKAGYRSNISRILDQVPVKSPAVIPQCTFDEYIYDPVTHSCAEPCTQAHCENGLIFDSASSDETDYGTCTCTYNSECSLPCWARPLVLYENNSCHAMFTQGPCDAGQVLLPVDRQTAECGPDVCVRSGPKNAINFSKWAQNGGDGNNDKPFLFTHKNECYMTETEAFCEPGKVARFMVPYKSPFCVPRDYDECSLVAPSSSIAKVECEAGFVEDSTRNLCVPQVELD